MLATSSTLACQHCCFFTCPPNACVPALLFPHLLTQRLHASIAVSSFAHPTLACQHFWFLTCSPNACVPALLFPHLLTQCMRASIDVFSPANAGHAHQAPWHGLLVAFPTHASAAH